MHEVEDLLSSYWLDKLKQYKSIKVAYSGGLDSTVLLHKLACTADFREKILAVHVNHGISSYANEWQSHCENYCLSIGVPIVVSRIKLAGLSNLEELARNARYAIFKSLLSVNDCIVLGHHSNDQAETILLNLLRGTGVDGLSGMEEVRNLGYGEVVRPFLYLNKSQLEKYAKQNLLTWVEDDSNISLQYSRNYLRHEVLPMLTKKWPHAIKTISESAQKCKLAKNNLDILASIDHPEINYQKKLSITPLLAYDNSRIINILRSWFKKNNILSPGAKIFDKLISEVLFARQDSQPEFTWGNVVIKRYRNFLYLLPKIKKRRTNVIWVNFPNAYKFEDGVSLSATIDTQGVLVPKDSVVEIRFREGGESLQLHGQTKKLKTLFQEWGVEPWLRDFVPLIYINGCLRAVVGHVLADNPVVDLAESYKIFIKDITENTDATTIN